MGCTSPELLCVCRAWHSESCDSSEGGDSGAKDSPSSCFLCGLHLTVWMETAGRCFLNRSASSLLCRDVFADCAKQRLAGRASSVTDKVRLSPRR